MKPAILVKTVKGHKYFQLRNTGGQLIHLGPADKQQSWTLAYFALNMEYSALAMKEIFSHEHLAESQGISIYEAMNEINDDEVNEKWYSLAKKNYVKDAVTHAAFRRSFKGIDCAELEKIAEKAEIDFETYKRTAEVTNSTIPNLAFICSKEGFEKLADDKKRLREETAV